MPIHIHGIIEITSVGADSISAQDTGAEMDSAPTPAKLIVFTDIKLIIYKILCTATGII